MKRKERRDENVLAYCRREISLGTRITGDKTKYTRKQKHNTLKKGLHNEYNSKYFYLKTRHK